MSAEVKQVPIQILGKEYVVGAPADETAELMESARYLDRKMRDIRDTGKVIGTERIAVMAALNLAHELLTRGQSSGARHDPAADARLRIIQEKIDAVLASEERQLKI